MAIAPVEVNDLGEGVLALLVVNDKEVAAPFVVRDVEGHRSGAVAGQAAILIRSLVSARGITLQGVFILARPPPVVIQLIEGIVQHDRRLASRAVFVDHSDVELPVLVRVVVAAVFRGSWRQVDAHITLVRRELRRERGDAEITTLLKDLHDEGAVHHLGGIYILQRTEANVRVALRVQLSTEERNLLRLKALQFVDK